MEMKAVGIDVSKDRLDVHVWPDGIAFAVARDGKGLAELIERLTPLTPDLVVVEATGGFETVVAAALAGAGLPLVVANPAQIRHFAQAAGTRAKTDPIDAAMIARFGHDIKPDVRPLPDEATQLLADLVARRRQIIEMIGAERNRERRATVRRIKKSILRLVRALEKELAEIDAEIDAGVRGSPAWRDKEDLLASVPASARSSPEPSSPNCPSSAPSTARRSPASPALLPTPASLASGRARA
jgi:transposase